MQKAVVNAGGRLHFTLLGVACVFLAAGGLLLQRWGHNGGSKKPDTLAEQTSLPKLIHQTWKTKAAADLPPDVKASVEDWQRVNPGYTHTLYDDDDILQLIRTRQPWLESTYDRLWPVEKADLFRYLVLHEHGGYYADVDVTPAVPCERWFVEAGELPRRALLVGVEKATDRPDWKKYFARRFQLVQWTIAAPPRHPALLRLLYMVAAYVQAHRSAPPTERPEDIMESTGPGIFTDAILEHMEEASSVIVGNKFDNQPSKVLEVDKGVVVRRGFATHDVVLLPQAAFASGSGGEEAEGTVFVRHTFKGSWKPQSAAGMQQLSDGPWDQRWSFHSPDGPKAFPSDLPGRCNYTAHAGSILRHHPAGLSNSFDTLPEAMAYCGIHGGGCGGVTLQNGRYEARAGVEVEEEEGGGLVSYLKHCTEVRLPTEAAPKCNYSVVPNSVLRGHPEGMEQAFEDRAAAQAWCFERGDACGGVTLQGGKYEARASDNPDSEEGPESYVKHCEPATEILPACKWTWAVLTGGTLPSTPPGGEPQGAHRHGTLDEAKLHCEGLGARCLGIVERPQGFESRAGGRATPRIPGKQRKGDASAHVRLCLAAAI